MIKDTYQEREEATREAAARAALVDAVADIIRRVQGWLEVRREIQAGEGERVHAARLPRPRAEGERGAAARAPETAFARDRIARGRLQYNQENVPMRLILALGVVTMAACSSTSEPPKPTLTYPATTMGSVVDDTTAPRSPTRIAGWRVSTAPKSRLGRGAERGHRSLPRRPPCREALNERLTAALELPARRAAALEGGQSSMRRTGACSDRRRSADATAIALRRRSCSTRT